MTEPVLYVDTNFVADLFGRGTWDGTTGVALLDDLDTKYDIRLTSTVQGELDQPGYELQATWFTGAGITATNTDAYSALTNGGERSIASVIDPAYVDAALGATTNYDSSLPSLTSGNLLVGSSDSWFSGNGYGSITVSSQTVLGNGLVDGTVSLDNYNSYMTVNSGELVIQSPENVIADNLTDMGVDAGVNGSGDLTIGGDVVATTDGLHAAVAANTMVPLAQDAETSGDAVSQAQDNAQIVEAIKPDDVALGVAGTDALATHLAIVTAEGGATDTLAAVLAGLSGVTGVAAVGAIEVAVAEHLGLIDSTDTDNLVSNYYWALTNPADVLKEGGMEIGGAFHSLGDAITGALGHFGNGETQHSPLVIDLSSGHTGITLTEFNAATTATFYDLDRTGFAEQTAWITGDTGFLVQQNTDGSINLFGTSTIDGFAELAKLDSNHDLKIDSSDTNWSSLNVWLDSNGNGVVDSGELHSLGSLDITSIDLAGIAPSTDVIDGNPISHTSTVTFSDDSTTEIADAWLEHSTVNTIDDGSYNLDLGTLFMPDLRGYGTVPDLDIAMSQNSTLKGLVSDFASGFSLSSFADPSTLDSDVTNILYQWAGVESVDPSSRGPDVNAQDLEFLEQLFGQNFSQFGNPNPDVNAAALVETAWQEVRDAFKADLLVQTGAVASLFDGAVTYNPWTGTFDGTIHLSETGIENLATYAPTTTEGAAEAFWVSVADFIDNTEGISNLTTDEQTWLDSAVTSTTTIAWSDVVDLYDHSGVAGSYIDSETDYDAIYGTSGDDQIYASGSHDTIYETSGNNTIQLSISSDYGNYNTVHLGSGDNTLSMVGTNNTVYADSGNNTIDASGGYDTFHMGTGGNTISAAGNDTFIYGGGGDTAITEHGGTNEIVLPSGITSSDVSFFRITSDDPSYFNDLLIKFTDGGSIQVEQQFNPLSSSQEVQTLEFSDSSTIDLTALTGMTWLVTGDETVSVPSGSGASDIQLTGGDNNVTLSDGDPIIEFMSGGNHVSGGSGDDTYVAGPGYNVIQETAGTNTIDIPPGYTMDDVTLSRVEGTYGPTSDLLVTIAGLGEIQLVDQFYASGYGVENLYFADDSSTVSLTGQTIDTIGTPGDDSLSGVTVNAGGNWFDGRGGDDSFTGGIGDNTFNFNAGFGTNTISLPYHTGNTNTIELHDIDPADIRMWTTANGNLHIQDTTDTSHSITVVADVTGSGYGETAIGGYLEQIKFDDSTTWDLTGGLTLTGTSGYDTLYGSAYGDTISGLGGGDVMYGNGGNDTLISAAGSADYMYGGAGNDMYVFPSGFGSSFVTDNADGSASNTIHLTGIDPADIRMWTGTSGSLHIEDTTNPSDNITVYAGETGSGTHESMIGSFFSEITFDSGYSTTWSLTGGLTLSTSDSGGSLYGTGNGDTLNGGSGSDTIYANAGNNTISGNGGDDYIYLGTGADTVLFKGATAETGVDTIYNFDTAKSDKLDIADVISTYDPLTMLISNFVELATSGGNTQLKVDTDGSGTSYTQIATLSGVTGLNLSDMITDGNLVVHHT